MNSEKKHLISNVVNIITDTVNIVDSSNQTTKKVNSEERLANILGITHLELVAIATFVADILPEKLYLQKYKEVKDYAVGLIAKELILFLVQEDKYSEYFKNNLENFRDEMLSNIISDVYLDDADKLLLVRG